MIIEPLSVRFYSNSSTGEAVSFGKNDTPLFTQDFPAALSFNPPGHSQGVDGDMDFECPAGTPLGHPNDEHHRPWALFKRETDGTCSVHNAGNGSSFQPGVDPPAGPSAFQAGIRSWVQIGGAAGQPVSVDFRMRSDDGFIIGFGRKDGAATGTFPSNPNGPGGTTILDEYPAMARSDASQFASGGQTFTVQFPEPGRYPVEIDYANCCNEPFPQGALTLVLTANGTYLVPGSPPAATATPTSTSTHTPTATATPAPPIESPPTDTLYNPPFINAGTSAGGAHTFTGRFHTAEVDVAIAGRGPSPVLARTYNGGDPRAGALGSNWIHSYEMRVTRAGDGSGDVFLTGPMGRVDRYPPSGGGGGALAPPEGVLGAVDSQSSSAGRAPGAADGPAWLDALFGDAGPRGLFERITRFFAPRGALAAPSAQASTVDYTPPPGVHTKLRRNADYTFTATHKDQTTWRFNATGRLHQIKDRYGNESTLAYDGAGRLSSVSDPAGRSASGLTFTHDPGTGRLTKVSDWLSPAREVQYQYDAQGRLWKVTDREGAVTEYGYDGTSTRLTTIKDPLGNVQVTNTYDAAGRVETQKDARGPSTGQQTAYAYTANADGTRRTDVTYPQTSFAPTWNSAARDDYDARGWLTRRELKPTAAETLVEQAAYDAIGNLVSVSDPRGGTTTFCYDTALDGVTPLNTRGNLTRRIDPQDVNGIRPTTLFRYSTDQKDNLELVVPPNGVPSGATTGCSENFSGAATSAHRTELAYDATGVRLVAVTQRHTDPDAGLQTATTKYEYTDSSNPGRITRAIPPRGNTSATPDASYATTFSWFGSGARAGMLDRVTDPLGNITTFDYDAVGRRTSAVGPLGNVSGANPAHFSSTTTYDREDRPRVTSAPAPNAGGAAITAENRYDAAGNRTVAIDPLGQVTRYLYDERNQLSEVRQSPSAWTDPNAEPGDRIATTYDYDHLAALKRVTRAQGDAASERVTDYENDGLGRTRRELQYPAWPSTSGALVNAATYDGNGNRATLTQPDGLTTTFAHDALNRLTGVTYADGQTPSVSYAYDKNGNRTQMVDGQGTTTYAYDERDAMLSTTSPLPGCGAGSVIGYRYDLDGNRTKVVYPPSSGCGASADAVTYLFDKASRLESLVGWDNRKTAYDYFPDGALKGATFSIANVDKTRSDYAYDNARRLTQVDNRFVGNGLNEVDAITSHAYGVDAAGNRTAVQERAARVGSFAPNPAAAPDPLMKEPPGGVGGPATSLALDGTGRPVIAYVDQTTFQLRVLRCGGADCGPAGAGDPLNVQLLDGAAEPAGATFAVSLALDQQNRPIVAFPGLSGTGQNAVVVIRCGDAECGTHTREVIEEGSDFGYDHVSLVLDGAGRPAISYQNREAWQLKVARCGDAQCTPATTTVSAPIPTGDGHSGYHSAIAIGADNLPIVAHNDARALRVVRCANATCSSAASHAAPEPVTNDAFSGRDNSIRLDAAGNPVIAYARSGEGTNPSSVRVLHCTNAGCTGAQAPATLDANPGGWTSLRLDARGFPVVSFFDATGADLELARCNDAACATAAVVRASPDTAGGVGKGTSLALDAAGYPVISYFDETNGDLRVLRCNSASCGGAPNVLPTPTVAPTATPAAGTVAVPDWNGDVGRFTSIALDAQGNPVVGYLDVTNGALKVLDCASPGCGPGSASLAADSGVAGVLNGSLEIDGQGRPVVAYLGAAGLTILRCGDASCASGNTITATGITGAGELSLALDGQDRPVVAFNERTQLDLALMRCGDATCTTHSLTRPDTATDTGWSPSLRLDAADRPVILFHQGFNFGAALLHCADPTCSAGGSHSLRAIQINEQASHTALALTADGGVAMAYRTASGLTFVRCDDLDCTGTLTPRVLDTGPATWIAIAADSTSRATISYAVADAGGSFDLKLVRCGNTACAVGNTTTVADSAGSVGEYTSIALDASGYPIVSYYDRTNGDLKVLRCANPTCAGGNPPQATPTIVPTPTQTPSSTPTATPTPTTTPSPTETLTPSTTPTASSTPTASNTPTITPSPTPTVPPNRIIVADAGELVGQYSSLALDASGVPAVSYFGANYLQLLFFRCADASCPATGNTQRALDQSGNAGTHSSIAIDAAGNPVISYRDDLSDTLKVLRCGDATCSAGNTTATPDAAGDVGQFTSIALNAAGNAVVSYYAGAGGELKLLVCGNAACTSGNSVAVIDPGVANDGQSTSLALDAAGNPVVSYYSPSNGDLKVITCGDATCSSGNTIAFPDRTGDVGGGTSLRIGATGKPVVAYSDTTTLRLKLLLCGDATCTRGNTIRHLDALGGHPSLALDSQGRPVVSYQDAANGDVKVLRCGDAACSSGNTVAAADGPAVVGSYTSLELDQSDRPVVSYHDGTNGDLKLLLCGTPTCAGTPLGAPAPVPTSTPQPTPTAAQPWITTVDWEGSVGSHTSVRLNAGKPVVAYRDETYQDLKLLVCGDATCRSGNVVRELDTGRNVGQHASLALDAGGAPVVAYYDVLGQDLKLARCADPACDALPAVTAPDTAGNVGQYASVQVDAAGRPVVAYAAQSGSSYSLKLLRCGDTTCSAGNSITTVDGASSVGWYASLVLDAAGNPVIAYMDVAAADLKLAVCADATCSAGTTIRTLEQTGSVGHYARLVLDASGRPAVAHASFGGGVSYRPRVVRCGDATCSAGNTVTALDFDGAGGEFLGFAVRSDDKPVLAYSSYWFQRLRLAFCADPACAAGTVFLMPEPESLSQTWSSLALDEADAPAVSYYGAALDLKVLRCVEATCDGSAPPLTTSTPTPTATPTSTPTATPTATPVPTVTPTPTPGPTSTNTVAPTPTNAPNRIVVAESANDVGQHTSLVLDSAGLPVVAHQSVTSSQPRFFKCANLACTTGNISRSLDGGTFGGTYTSIALDSSGRPVISYRDDNSRDLRVIRCGDATCSAGNSLAIPDGPNDVGQYTSLVLNAAGNPVISYHAFDLGDLKILTCGNATCTSGNTVASPDTETNVGQWTSLALNAAGNPVVSYYGVSNGDVRVLTCGNATCTSGNTVAVLDKTGGATGQYTSLALDAQGRPVVSYADANYDLRIARCGDATCSQPQANTITVADASGSTGLYTSLALDGQGRPVVSYYDSTGQDLKVLRCGDATCSSGNTIATPDAAGVVGWWTALALDANGFPVISYYDYTNGNLKLLFCGSATCLGSSAAVYVTPTATAVPAPAALAPWIVLADREDVVGSHTSLKLNAGKPVVAYRDETYRDLKLLVCGVNTCASGNLIRTLDTVPDVGQFASLALDASAYPVVSYYDAGAQDLRIARCGDATCLAPPTITVPDSSGNVGQYTSLQLDASGFPVVAYAAQSGSTYSLKLLRCGDATCASGNTITTVSTTGSVGAYASLRLNASGFPVIAFYDATNLDLRVVTCGNATCSSGNTFATVDSAGNVGEYASLRLDSQGRPVIAYVVTTGGRNAKIARCGNATCTSGNTIRQVDFGFNTGPYVSLALRGDDRPVLGYFNGDYGAGLKLYFCGDATCSAGNAQLGADAGGGNYVSLELDANGVPAISHYDNTDLRVVRCKTNNACVQSGGGLQSLGGAILLETPTPTATATATETPTATVTGTPPTSTPSATPTPSPEATATPTVAPTETPRGRGRQDDTATPTTTATATATATVTPAATATSTASSTSTATASTTATATATMGAGTATAAATSTATTAATSTPVGGVGGSGFAPDGGPEVAGVQAQALPCASGPAAVSTPIGVSPATDARYEHDRLSRLTCAAGPWVSSGTTYSYDPVGNRLSMVRDAATTAYGYDRADRIQVAGTTAYTVNSRGNLLARGGDAFAYDQANRLTAATVGGNTSTYAYSGDGLRVAQTAGGNTTRYTWDVNRSLPVALVEGTTRHVWGAGGLAWSVLEDDSTRLYHTDGLGSVRAVTDGQGVVQNTYRTDEFGVPDPSGTSGLIGQAFQFTGEPRDASGLVYLRARHLDPTSGRFVTRDPLAGLAVAPSSLNRYVYVGNNPTTLTDPSGLASRDVWEWIKEQIEKGCLDPDSHLFCWYPGSRPTAPGQPAIIHPAGLRDFDFAGIADDLTRASRRAASKASSAGAIVLEGVGGGRLRRTISISEARLHHAIDGHTIYGSKPWLPGKDKSVFGSQENLIDLVQAASSYGAVKQSTGNNFETIVDAGRTIGIDRDTGQWTSIYTVITDASDNLITMFPGRP